MEQTSILDGWLALAAETRRVDRISATLGLDSPALQNSPSSLGSSCGSSGLNTPSQNAFRILPFLNDISPEYLKATSIKTKSSSSSRQQPQFKTNNNRHNPLSTYGRRPSTPTRPPVRSGLSSHSMPNVPPLSASQKESQPHSSYDAFSCRPPPINNRNLSYPAWPAPKPVTSSGVTNDVNEPNLRGRQTSRYPHPIEARDLRSPFQPKSLNEGSSPNHYHIVPDSYSPQQVARRHGYLYDSRPVAVTDSVSPMLSEPFHRLIVKDEEDMIDLSSMPPNPSNRGALGRGGYHDTNASQLPSYAPRTKRGDMNMVTEEEQEVPSWWEGDPMRDMTFEFDTAPSIPGFHPVAATNERPESGWRYERGR